MSDSFDAADNWIAERVGPGDIVVTADIPLADRSLKAGASAIGNTGVPFTADVDRHGDGQPRAAVQPARHGRDHRRPQPMAQRDRSRFLSALDEAIQSIRRRRA